MFSLDLKTYTDRILLVNATIFVLMTIAGGSILIPPDEVLMNFGAKDALTLAQGEWWRFVTPVFVHIGIIHFALNSMALRYLGRSFEHGLGKNWFLAIYIISGIGGNLVSSVIHFGMGAGASGAIFGLLGSGFLLEKFSASETRRVTGAKPRMGAYTSMALINLVMGMMIPAIDNAAHLGGFLTGIVLTYAMLKSRENRVVKFNPTTGRVVLLVFAVFMLFLASLGGSKEYVSAKLMSSAQETNDLAEKKYYLDQLLALDPNDDESRFSRGVVFVAAGMMNEAIEDFYLIKDTRKYEESMFELRSQLAQIGRAGDALRLQKMYD